MIVEQNVEKNVRYKFVAPEGGWGYMIFAAFVLIMSTETMFMGCYGMLYNNFMKEIGMNSTSFTFLTGINAFCFSIAGFFTDSLLKIMSRRKLAMIGVLLLNMGTVGMVFAKTTLLFYLFQGILPGFSIGITFNICSSILNDYFVKRRLFAFSFVQLILGVLCMVAPLFIQWSLDTYGFRGTLVLIAGISMHNILGVLLMQPVQWHMKKEAVTVPSESKALIVEDKSPKTPTINLNDIEAIAPQDADEDKESKSFVMEVIGKFVEVSFFKKFIISCACLGPALCNYAELTYTLILPQALYSLGWDQSSVALALSLYGFGDLAMRTILTFTSNWLLKIGSQEIYIIGLIIGCVSRLGMLWSVNKLPMYIYMVLMGVARCFILVLIAVIVADAAPPEKFTQAMGIFMMVAGVTVLVLGPAIGAIRDLTNSYLTAFYLLTSLLAIIILFWSIELCYKKNKQKRKNMDKPIRTNKEK